MIVAETDAPLAGRREAYSHDGVDVETSGIGEADGEGVKVDSRSSSGVDGGKVWGGLARQMVKELRGMYVAAVWSQMIQVGLGLE